VAVVPVVSILTELNGDFPKTIRVLPDTTMATEVVADLYDSADPSLWRAALGCYEETVKTVAAQKKKSRTEGLVQLDTWWVWRRTLIC